jgi:general stress protein 26
MSNVPISDMFSQHRPPRGGRHDCEAGVHTKEHAMDTQVEIEAKFWKALKGDRTAMLGLVGVEEGQSQPMTAQLLEEDQENGGPIWFFTSKDTDFARSLGESHRAQLHFASKNHELFAAVHGTLAPHNDPATIDRLWNKWVAAWFEGGRNDPKLLLLRFDPEHAQIWLNENSVFAGIRILLGRDPKQDYRRKVAEVDLRQH